MYSDINTPNVYNKNVTCQLRKLNTLGGPYNVRTKYRREKFSTYKVEL